MPIRTRAAILALFVSLGFALSMPAQALTVSPAKIEITADPGRTVHSEFELLNEQDATKTFYSSFENFEPSGETGAPKFIGGKDELATWIATNRSVTLKPNERRTIAFSITVPANAEPGGHFGAIFWGTQEPSAKSGGQVSIGGKLGILILLRVSGDVKEGAGLLEFNAKDGDRFFSTVPISLSYRINNTGGDRIVPRGTIKIRNTFGVTTATISANKKEGSVLSSSTRKFEAIWGEELDTPNDDSGLSFFESVARQWQEFHLGVYKATLALEWGDTPDTARESYYFFIIPWQLILVIVLIGGGTIFLGTKGLKKYNRWIIAQSTQRR